MRIIHTADWHIGKLLCEYSLLEDQRDCLFSFADQIESLGADVLLIAGDLYDRSVPSAEAVSMLDELFSYLLFEKHIKILAISGNHDSAKRLSFGSRLMQSAGLYLKSTLDCAQTPVILSAKGEEAAFFLLPYFEPHQFRESFDAPDCRTVQVCMNHFLTLCKKNIRKNCPNILVAHGFFSAHEEDADLTVAASSLTALCDHPFSYVALGHLHGARTAGSEWVRYSGSPMKYSIDEAGQKKSFTVIDIEGGQIASVFEMPIHTPRDVRKISGTLDALCEPEHASDDYVFAVLTDPQIRANAIRRLKQVYPHTLGLSYDCLQTAQPVSLQSAKHNTQNDPIELFEQFFKEAKQRGMTDSEQAYTKAVFHKVKGDALDDSRSS